MKKITVIGAGQMGSAICFPACDNGNEICLVGTPLDREIIEHASWTGFHLNLKRKLPDGIKYFQFENLDEAITGADFIIGGVSSFGVDWLADEVIPRIPDIPVLSVTKGMLDNGGSLLSYPAYYDKKYPGRIFCAVGGPCTSYELADRDPTHIAFCGSDPNALREMKEAMTTDYYNISLTSDVEGLECAVALKNVYALAVTLAVGMSNKKDGVQHYNSQAALFGQSVKEMRRLLKIFGCGEDNLIHGVGDLFVTVFGGRTRKIGTLLGEGIPFDAAMKTLEGVTLESVVIATRTARALRELINQKRADKKDYPLLLHVDDLINNGANLCVPWGSFTEE